MALVACPKPFSVSSLLHNYRPRFISTSIFHWSALNDCSPLLPYQCFWEPSNVLISFLVPYHSNGLLLKTLKLNFYSEPGSYFLFLEKTSHTSLFWGKYRDTKLNLPLFTAPSSPVPIPGTFAWPLTARGKPRRGMLRRAVFSDVQRKALEKMFQKQKYISKPDRKKLATKLGLKDSQVGWRCPWPIHLSPRWKAEVHFCSRFANFLLR